MKITVKKLKIMQTLDFPAVQCEVYADGIKIGIYHDDGMGGEPNFQVHPNCDKTRALFDKVIEYAKTLPKIDLNASKRLGNTPQWYQPDFDMLVEDAINEKEREDRFKKQSRRYIMFGKHIDTCQLYYWKGKTLEQMMYKHPQGVEILQARIDIIKKELKEGERILNAEYLKSLGLKV